MIIWHYWDVVGNINHFPGTPAESKPFMVNDTNLSLVVFPAGLKPGQGVAVALRNRSYAPLQVKAEFQTVPEFKKKRKTLNLPPLSTSKGLNGIENFLSHDECREGFGDGDFNLVVKVETLANTVNLLEDMTTSPSPTSICERRLANLFHDDRGKDFALDFQGTEIRCHKVKENL